MCPAVTTDDGAVYLRRIRDLAPPEQEGQRPLCVDMRVQVGCEAVTQTVMLGNAAGVVHVCVCLLWLPDQVIHWDRC